MPAILRPTTPTAKRLHSSNQIHETSKAYLAAAALSVVSTPLPSAPHLVAALYTGGESFGTVLGEFESVQVHSCLLPPGMSALDMELATFHGTCTGVQWQCVELARRYLLQLHGVVFDCIPIAHDMFTSAVFRDARSRRQVRATHAPQGGTVRPVKGSLLIWKNWGVHAPTGHVAVIVAVTNTHVDIIEQNFINTKWPKDRPYSRRLTARVEKSDNGERYVIATQPDREEMLGWITLDSL
ncbi:Aste57867_12261 [Aphanomyces stellatus]|uniref:Aste57867_12261 protein n=1 Tax=Aphanomyces stellatus TaxID=120398 RepID=A0A485KV25_9STRA|nr:hypothetical protein As57867_012216 [Aphanomyces stellatus]VFT89114.1 Aste57867_12261 [Aphanomyces stellatus]